MKLLYKIEFFTTNFYYVNILEDLVKKFGINAKVQLYKDFILLSFDDEGSKIEDFFKFLEPRLPISIFLGTSSVVEDINPALRPHENHFIKEENILMTNENIKGILENSDADFLDTILKISKQEICEFKIDTNFIEVFLPNKTIINNFENKKEEVNILITDLSILDELFDINMKEMQLLSSIERPLVKLKFKLGKNTNNEYSSSSYAYVKLPDDKQTLLFAKSLKQKDIKVILYVDKNQNKNLKVTYNSEQNIIISGNKFLFPKYDLNANKVFNDNFEYFEDNNGIYKATLAQFGKRLVPSVGIYFSLKSQDSKVKLNIPTKGLRDVIHVGDTPTNINALLDEIALIDEDRQRLVNNYKNKFPKLFEDNSTQNMHGFESLLLMCGKVLGINSAKEFEDFALSMNIKSGIQIDFKIMKVNNLNYLDYKKTVQSIMSYKMADVDNGTLAYSVFESLSEFICNYSDEISKEIKAKDIVLCGDMFANNILLSKTMKNLSKNYNVLLPKEYPLDY